MKHDEAQAQHRLSLGVGHTPWLIYICFVLRKAVEALSTILSFRNQRPGSRRLSYVGVVWVQGVHFAVPVDTLTAGIRNMSNASIFFASRSLKIQFVIC